MSTRDRDPDHDQEPELPRAWVERMRREVHPPGATPRERMWAAVEQAIRDGTGEAAQVVELRTRRRARRWPAWAAAAAAVLAVGIGIGRWSATSGPAGATASGDAPVAAAPSAPAGGAAADTPAPLQLASRLHFERAEPLLASVRADARAGRVDASLTPWARQLLTRTRLLLDARAGTRDEIQLLLADLELVLAQIVRVDAGGARDADRAREELRLTARSLDEGSLLARVRAQAPGQRGAR